MLLTENTLPHYCLSRGLLTASALVDGELTVADAGGRNRCFSVFRGAEPGLFVKQVDVLEPPPDTDVACEAALYRKASDARFTELARVMPQEKFSWAPGEGIMQVGEVYMHLARYNFMYLDENLGIAPPNGFDYSQIESLRDKEKVREIWEMSVQHVKQQLGAMTESALSSDTRLYGRTVPGWAVLVQLVSHMNEHVGQSVAYARMNAIAPPWAR